MSIRTERLSKDLYFMLLAEAVSLRSTCLDKHVGCVLVDSRGIVLSTGYNGAPHGQPHCIDLGVCNKTVTGNKDLCPSAHAEQNAIIHCAAIDRISSCYVTLSPCVNCVRLLANTPCEHIFFKNKHRYSEPEILWTQFRGNNSWHQIK